MYDRSEAEQAEEQREFADEKCSEDSDYESM